MKLLFLALLVASTPSSKEQIVNVVLPSGVRVSMVEAPFKGSGISVRGCTNAEDSCFVGGKPYGLATGLPSTYLRSIIVTYGRSKFVLDSSSIYNAAIGVHARNPKQRFFGGSCDDAKHCAFRAVFGDAADSTAVEWIVAGGIVERTVFTDDTDIIDLFEKYIDPPTYE